MTNTSDIIFFYRFFFDLTTGVTFPGFNELLDECICKEPINPEKEFAQCVKCFRKFHVEHVEKEEKADKKFKCLACKEWNFE